MPRDMDRDNHPSRPAPFGARESERLDLLFPCAGSALGARFRSDRCTPPRKEPMARPVSDTDARPESGAPSASQAAVRLEEVSKRFGEVAAVDGVTLDVLQGEF